MRSKGKLAFVCVSTLILAVCFHIGLHRVELFAQSTAWRSVKTELAPSLDVHGSLPSKVNRFARDLSETQFSKVPVKSNLRDVLNSVVEAAPTENVGHSDYAAKYPHSYFSAAPNANAKFVWVCPGPSLLEDYHAGACPLSKTGAFRCCIDASNGAAVSDSMCCPQKEVELRASPRLPSNKKLANRLAGLLEAIAIRYEKQQMAQLDSDQPRPVSYLSDRDSRSDIDSYFNSLSASPSSSRSLPSLAAQKDLVAFFKKLSKGNLAGLEPVPSVVKAAKTPLRRVNKAAFHTAASKIASALRGGLKSNALRQRAQHFESWRARSEGPAQRRMGVMARMAREEVAQRARADGQPAPRRQSLVVASGVEVPEAEVTVE